MAGANRPSPTADSTNPQEERLLSAFNRALDDRQSRLTLSPTQREEALQSALAAFEANPHQQPARTFAAYGWPLAAAAVVLLLAGAVFTFSTGQRQQATSQVQTSAPRAQSLAPGAELRAGPGLVRAVEPSVVQVTPAQHVRLERGRVHIAVTPTRSAPFRVATPAFTVEVVGTAFTLDVASVTVHEGRVRVLEAVTQRLLAELDAGQSYSTPKPSAIQGKPEGPPALEQTIEPPANVAETARVKPQPVAALLAEARARLARREPARARKLIGAALEQRPTASEAAEAETLLAECALVEGRTSAAISSYERVAQQETDPVAAENALFAAGRVAAEARDAARARPLLEKYLQRYPRGRFRREAEARLRDLD